MVCALKKNMIDNYSHPDTKLIYVTESVPGPPEDSFSYRKLIQEFNSQLTDSCNCYINCVIQTCDCHKHSGGCNYVYNTEISKNLLRKCKMKGHDKHPIIECNDLCSCSENCGNRIVQRGPLENLYIKLCETNQKGLGLFTEKFIAEGSFICEYAGEIITRQQAIARQKDNVINQRMNYIFCLNEHSKGNIIQTFVDPTFIGNIGRYSNHSCDPNSIIMPVRVNTPVPKLGIFSCKDIMPHTEITFQYGSHRSHESADSINKKICLCKSYNCSGLMPFEMY